MGVVFLCFRKRLLTLMAAAAVATITFYVGAQEPPGPPTSSSPTPSAESGSSPASAPSPDGKIDISAANTPIERVAGQMAQKSGKNVVARGKTSGQPVQLLARQVPLERALDMLVNSKPNWLWYKPDDQPNTYEIWDQESFRAEVLPKRVRQKVYLPREITAEEAYKAVQGVLTPNIGAASFDPRSNKVIVTDLPEVLELVQRLIEQIDVKFLTRVFYVAHADVNMIAEKLANLKSPAAPAPEVDVRTHQIIVRDRLEIIQQMELLVETLDIGPELRVYDINNVGVEGEQLQELEDAVSRVLTPDAYYKFHTQSGRLIVEDVPEVHEKVEKILAAIDQPAKQVWIQAEVIETAFAESFSMGTDYTFSADLFSSVIDGLTGFSPGSGTTAGTGGSVPIGKQTVTPETLGFLDFRKEFPFGTAGSGGLVVQNLSRHAFIQLKAAMSDARTRVLQQPRALVMNQKEIQFNVGSKVPYYTGGGNYYNNNSNNQNYYGSGPQLNFVNTGLDLVVRPTISNDGMVEMEVEISNNSADFQTITFANQQYTAPEVKTQEMFSVLRCPSGDTRMIGGLVSDADSEVRSGIPGLVKIPYIGATLFGSTSRPAAGNGRKNLLLFVTPTVVVDKPQDLLKYKGRVIVDEKAEESDYLTTPPATLADMQIEPIPVDPRIPVYQPGEPVTQMPADKVISSVYAPGQQPEDAPAAEPKPQTPQDEELRAEPASEGLKELKRIKIAEKATTSVPMMLPALAGPRGALSGPSTGMPPAPGTGVPMTPGAVAAPPPPVVTPVIAVTPRPVVQPTPPPPPPPPPPPTAPPAETRFQ